MSFTKPIIILMVAAALLICASTTATAWRTPTSLALIQTQQQPQQPDDQHNLDQANPTVTFSPFTINSNYLEVVIGGIPTDAAEGNEFKFEITTGGFEAKKKFELELEENYRANVNDSWSTMSGLTAVEYSKNSKTESKFKLKFNLANKKKKDGGYERFLRLKFDINKWTLDEKNPSILFKCKIESTKSSKSYETTPTEVAPFHPMAHSMKIAMSKADKKNSNKHHQNFTITLDSISSPLTPTSGDLVFYSYFDEYHVATRKDGENVGKCKLNDVEVEAKWNNGDSATQPYLTASLSTINFPINTNVTINCPEFVLYRNETTVHFSEYWVLYTTNDSLHATQYVGGLNRLDKFITYATWVVVVLILIVTLILFFITWCLCKKCQCCCYKPKADPRDVNLPITDYYASL